MKTPNDLIEEKKEECIRKRREAAQDGKADIAALYSTFLDWLGQIKEQTNWVAFPGCYCWACQEARLLEAKKQHKISELPSKVGEHPGSLSGCGGVAKAESQDASQIR